MAKLVSLTYQMILDPDETWQHAYQFENDLVSFFGAHGIEATFISPLEGSNGQKVVVSQKMDGLLANADKSEVVAPPKDEKKQENKEEKKKPQSPKDQMDKLRGKDYASSKVK